MAKVKNSGKSAASGRDVRRTAQSADERQAEGPSKQGVKGKSAKKRAGTRVGAATKGTKATKTPAKRAAAPKRDAPRKAAKVAKAAKSTPRKATGKPAAKRLPAKRASGKRAPAKRQSPKRAPAKGKGSSRGRPALRLVRGGAKPAAEVQIRIRDLDPVQKCGAATSVERLIRVDEIVGKVLTAHLVFLDHHGWYCEHGATCPAVSKARKHALVVRSPYDRNGTHNGRMRA